MLRKCKTILLANSLCLLFIGGCANYQPMPLTPQTVFARLRGPTMEDIRIKAGLIEHPILKPTEFNYNDGLSPDEASILAVFSNPQLRAIRDQRATANAQLLQAGLLPNPQLGLTTDKPMGGTTEGAVNAYGVDLSWDVMELISHSARVSAAEKEKASVALDIAWQEWQIAEAAKSAVYDLFSLHSQLDIATESDQRLKDNFGVVQKAVQAGLMTELDISAAETASHQSHAAVLELQKQVSEQSFTLNQILGLSVDANTTLQNDIELPVSIKVPDTNELLNELEKRRLDLVALRLGYESQENTLRAAVLSQFPRINIGFNKARDTGNVVTTGFGITIDLPIFNQNQGEIAIERATRQQLFDEYVNRIFETRTDIAKLTANIPLIINQIETAQAAVISSKKLVETYRTAIERGQADILSYYTAWNDLNDRQIEIIKLKQQLVDTRIALELTTGLYNLNDLIVPDSNSIEEVAK